MKNFIADESAVDSRLDKFLTEKTNKARNQIRSLILNEQVLVNDKKAKVHQFLRLKDKISLLSEVVTKVNTEEKEKLGKKPAPTPNPIIIEENDDYLIIEKPIGLLVHNLEGKNTPTLVDWLIKKYPEINKITDEISVLKKDKTFRPGIVHRLDRDVSGIMLVARNQTAYDYFKKLFKLRQVKKEYLALAHGQVPFPHGSIDFRIGRQSGGGRMVAHPASSELGRPALTEYEAIENFINFTYLKAEPHTGRTNQIRVHFFALGTPLAGDPMYKQKKFKPAPGLKRLFLHAHRLTFVDQHGEEKTYLSPLPEELETALLKIK